MRVQEQRRVLRRAIEGGHFDEVENDRSRALTEDAVRLLVEKVDALLGEKAKPDVLKLAVGEVFYGFTPSKECLGYTHLFRIGRIPGPPAVLEDGKSAAYDDLGRRILAAKKRGGR